jgi:hypothetical protein
MAKLETKLEIIAGNKDDSYSCSMSDNYQEVYRTTAKVDNTDSFISLATLSKTNTSALKGAKVILIKNNSPVGVELQFQINEYSTGLTDTYAADRHISQFLAGGEYIILPNQFMIGSNGDNSVANSAGPNNQGGYDVATDLANDSAIDNDDATDDAMTDDTSSTRVYLEQYTSAANCGANAFFVGDLIRLDNEIMEVTAIGDKSDLANNYLDVKRGMYGSTTAVHADDVAIELPFFNTQGNYNDYTYAQTNGSGRYTAKNLIGKARLSDSSKKTGIVRGSFAMKFYNAGYQELNLTGITPSTHSGLAASTTYGFNITVDGGSEFVDLSFTTDASNLNFGGNNGVISKIQAALDTQFYTAGNLFEKKVTVGIVGGDIRFTSGQRTRASAIALANAGSATNFFGVGRVPAVAAIETAVGAKLPDDTIFSKDDYVETKNQSVFAYDDGKGNILGVATGTLNYQTGEIDFTGPPNTEPVFSFITHSALSGGIVSDANLENSITEISARSCNSKIDAEVELLGFV